MTIEGTDGGVESISAVTLATQSMAKSVDFYRSLGLCWRREAPRPSSRRSELMLVGAGHLQGFGRRPDVLRALDAGLVA